MSTQKRCMKVFAEKFLLAKLLQKGPIYGPENGPFDSLLK